MWRNASRKNSHRKILQTWFVLSSSCNLILKGSLFQTDNKLSEEIKILPGIFQEMAKTCGKIKVFPYISYWMYSTILVVKDAYEVFCDSFSITKFCTLGLCRNQHRTEINLLSLWFVLIQLICKREAQFSPAWTTLPDTTSPQETLSHSRIPFSKCISSTITIFFLNKYVSWLQVTTSHHWLLYYVCLMNVMFPCRNSI